MKRLLLLFWVLSLFLCGCIIEETMYIKPVVLMDSEINNMIKRHGGILEYSIDNSVEMITLYGIKYETNMQPEVVFNYKTAFNSDFSGKTSKLVYQVSEDNGSVSLLTESASAETIIERVEDYKLRSISLIGHETEIIPDKAIPFHVLLSSSGQNSGFSVGSDMTDPSNLEEHFPMILFLITFHSHISEE